MGKTTSIPDFSDAEMATNLPMMTLKSRCAASKPLGIIRITGAEELLVVYDGKSKLSARHPIVLVLPNAFPIADSPAALDIGCYTTKFGVPTRSAGYLRWEFRADSYVHRGEHVLLFSLEFIEIRTVRTGKLVQVIEGAGMRRVDVGLLGEESRREQEAMKTTPTTMYVTNGREADGLVGDTIVELIETAELQTTRATEVPGMWDEFEMM